MKNELFSCRSLYKHHSKKKASANRTFEERIVLIRAKSFKDALIQAEKEAKQYCRQLKNCTYLGHVDAFIIHDKPLKHGSEIYSLMRESGLTEAAYIRRFFETGKEYQSEICF